MHSHSETCRMVTAKLLTGTDRDCDCGVAYDDLERENVALKRIINDDDGLECLRLRAALEKAVTVEARSLWNRCIDCDTTGSCTGEKLCIAGERGHTWIHQARQALAGGEGE